MMRAPRTTRRPLRRTKVQWVGHERDRCFGLRMRHSRRISAVAAGLVLCAVIGWFGVSSLIRIARPRTTPPASFVGSAACRSCHAAESDAWSRSHHRSAMADASDATVLGRFDGATIRVGSTATSFFTRDGKFFARTNGADGKLAEYEIKYTFGVYPLQQYLVALAGGRLQALTIAWDARAADEGGQRWFPLYPDSRSSDDELHWTRPAQNWNYMCADCHSTGVRKNYDAIADTFRTTWSEVSVGCEACHGPGSRHVAWAGTAASARERARDTTMGLTVQLDERRGVAWTVNASTGNAARSHVRTSDRELQVCAQCHSRRRQLSDGYVAGKSFYDFYRPALLADPLYYADGQQRGEVYEWGSFLQSRMNAHGVTCSDCHEPHSGTLRAPGSSVCARCHSAAKYDSREHDHHATATARVDCLSCHMPATTYMRIDARRDHSFRIPRPDLTVQIGTPNACASCHAARGAQWAAAQIADWRFGDTSQVGFQRFAPAFAAAFNGGVDAERRLADVIRDTGESPIARASALAQLPGLEGRVSLTTIALGINDANPLVRLGAVQGAMHLAAEPRAALVTPLLSDSTSVVRIDASSAQVGAPLTSSDQQSAFDRAAREFVTAQLYNADRADARTNLGTFYAVQGDLARAESELRAAIRLDPFWAPAYVNLADILRSADTTRGNEAERLLRAGLARAPADAALHHALGLALVRMRRPGEARAELQRAAALAPMNARFGYVYAVALHSAGQIKAAIAELNRVLAGAPNDQDVLGALIAFHRERGDSVDAKVYTARMQSLTSRER